MIRYVWSSGIRLSDISGRVPSRKMVDGEVIKKFIIGLRYTLHCLDILLGNQPLFIFIIILAALNIPCSV